MKITMKAVLLIVFVSVVLMVSLNMVQARFYEGGQDTYYDLIACTDGLIVRLAYGANPSQTTPVSARLTGNSLRDDPTLNFLDPTTFPLINGPVDIVDSQGNSTTLYYSVITSTSWTTSTLLLPGSRVALDLEMFPAVNVNNPFEMSVRDCTLTNPPPDRDSVIAKGNRFSFPANLNAPSCATGYVITSTIDLTSVNGLQSLPIADVNFSMWLRNTSSLPNTLKASDVRARLISPDATIVQLFDQVGGGDAPFRFATRGSRINNGLIGDPMANFVLDDSSVYQFSDRQSTICSTPNLSIPDADLAGVTDQITMPNGGLLADLNVVISTTHTYVGDLIYTLKHDDTGTIVTLIDRPGSPYCGENDINVSIDDEGNSPVENECRTSSPAISGIRIGGDPPNTSLLAAFDGESMSGTWSLNVSDNVGADVGTLVQWCLAPSTVSLGTDLAMVVSPPFNTTAVQPDQNLSAFNGKLATGLWTLEICNLSPVATGEVVEWYLQVEVDDLKIYLPIINNN